MTEAEIDSPTARAVFAYQHDTEDMVVEVACPYGNDAPDALVIVVLDYQNPAFPGNVVLSTLDEVTAYLAAQGPRAQRSQEHEMGKSTVKIVYPRREISLLNATALEGTLEILDGRDGAVIYCASCNAVCTSNKGGVPLARRAYRAGWRAVWEPGPDGQQEVNAYCPCHCRHTPKTPGRPA